MAVAADANVATQSLNVWFLQRVRVGTGEPQALGGKESPMTNIDLLLADLTSSDWTARRRAAIAAGELREPAAVGALCGALRDPLSPVHQAAQEALIRIGPPAISSLLALLSESFFDAGGRAAWTLIGIGPAAVDPLCLALSASNPTLRQGSAFALGELRDARAESPLVAALTDAEAIVRAHAARALGKVRGSDALAALSGALSDSDPGVRAAAAEALRGLADAKTIAPLCKALGDPNGLVGLNAVTALLTIGGPAFDSLLDSGSVAVGPLCSALRDDHEDIRVAAAELLGHLSIPVATSALCGSLTDASARVRKASAHALGRIGTPQASAAVRARLPSWFGLRGERDREVQQALQDALTAAGRSR